jgi:hypothetical protein
MSCITIGLLAVVFIVAGCGHRQPGTGWVTLIDGEKGLENWNRVGGANWRAEGGAIVADMSTTKGSSFLVTKSSYKDFEIRAEFWAESNTNSGIFIRCTDPSKITADNAYEVNIWDTRPTPVMARAPSSMSPRYRYQSSIKPAASGTRSRSRPRDRN